MWTYKPYYSLIQISYFLPTSLKTASQGQVLTIYPVEEPADLIFYFLISIFNWFCPRASRTICSCRSRFWQKSERFSSRDLACRRHLLPYRCQTQHG